MVVVVGKCGWIMLCTGTYYINRNDEMTVICGFNYELCAVTRSRGCV